MNSDIDVKRVRTKVFTHLHAKIIQGRFEFKKGNLFPVLAMAHNNTRRLFVGQVEDNQIEEFVSTNAGESAVNQYQTCGKLKKLFSLSVHLCRSIRPYLVEHFKNYSPS
jgi:hypothetical protein